MLASLGIGGWWGAERRLGGGQPVARAQGSPPPDPAPGAHAAAVVVPRRLLVRGPALLRHPFRPRLGARAAILVDASTGSVLWALRPHRRLPIASTTKIMTAVLALEHLRPGQRVRVPLEATRVPLVKEGLRAGERVRVWKLLDGLLVYSGNDDAYALAVAVAGSRPAFVGLMNEEARELGLRDTHFSSPSGVLDRDNRSSAWDLAGLARYAMRDPRFRTIVRSRIVRIPWSAPTFFKVYVNKNALLGSYPGADGIKTGWTTLARHCLVASAHRNGVRLVAVVLGSGNAVADARRLLNLGFSGGYPSSRPSSRGRATYGISRSPATTVP